MIHHRTDPIDLIIRIMFKICK